MGRQILSQNEVFGTGEVIPDDPEERGRLNASRQTADRYADRLIKYIPAEVVALYVFVEGLIRTGAGKEQLVILWIVFSVLLIGTWFYLVRVQRVTKKQQLLISTAAFAVWVFSLGGPFTEMGWYKQIYGQVLLPLYTFFVAIVEAKR